LLQVKTKEVKTKADDKSDVKKEKKVKEEKVPKEKKAKEEKKEKKKEAKADAKKVKAAANATALADDGTTTGEEVARFLHGQDDEGHEHSAAAAAAQGDQANLKGFIDALEQIGRTRPADKPWGAFKLVRCPPMASSSCGFTIDLTLCVCVWFRDLPHGCSTRTARWRRSASIRRRRK
jgi:hypothetical protein